MILLENQFVRYAMTLLFVASAGSRLDWLFGDEIRSAVWQATLGLCSVTNGAVCF